MVLFATIAMPYRLAGNLSGSPIRLGLKDGPNIVGSASGCDLRIDHPTVSRSHAELRVAEGAVVLQDLGSRNGTFLGEARVSEPTTIASGSVVAFGHVRLVLEHVEAEDLEAAVSFDVMEPTAPHRDGSSSTIRTKPIEVFTLEKLPGLLQLLAAGADQTRLAQAGGAALFETLPVASVDVTAGRRGAVLFEARRECDAGLRHTLSVAGNELSVAASFPGGSSHEMFRPLVEAVATLIGMAGGAKVAPPARSAAPPLPDPPSVVPEVARLYADAFRVARGEIGVLICGESGTGKEVLARFLHAAGARSEGPFVALNCAALPRDLLEVELFGIEKGVATGVEARAGKFELAHGGTLFLDEIGDMAAETQAKILRILQEGDVYRVGGSVPRPARVRVVAATHRDMARLLSEGLFREDLYYRIATWTAQVPALRHRKADIPNLAAHFLRREAAQLGVRIEGISRRALDVMTAFAWPGNIRQLEKEMARAVLFLGDGDLLDSSGLSPELRAAPQLPRSGRLTEYLETVEREEIRRALEECNGDVDATAERLGLARSTLYRRMKALGVEGR